MPHDTTCMVLMKDLSRVFHWVIRWIDEAMDELHHYVTTQSLSSLEWPSA